MKALEHIGLAVDFPIMNPSKGNKYAGRVKLTLHVEEPQKIKSGDDVQHGDVVLVNDVVVVVVVVVRWSCFDVSNEHVGIRGARRSHRQNEIRRQVPHTG